MCNSCSHICPQNMLLFGSSQISCSDLPDASWISSDHNCATCGEKAFVEKLCSPWFCVSTLWLCSLTTFVKYAEENSKVHSLMIQSCSWKLWIISKWTFEFRFSPPYIVPKGPEPTSMGSTSVKVLSWLKRGRKWSNVDLDHFSVLEYLNCIYVFIW